MAGIAPQSGRQAAPTGAQSADPDSEVVAYEEDLEDATPEEQAAYESFVLDGYDLLYGEDGKVNPSVLDLLDEEPSDLVAVLRNLDEAFEFTPTVALAATTVVVTLEVVRRSKPQPEDEIIIHGGKALLEELVEIAGQAGSYDYSEDEMAEAFRMAADLYREAAAEDGLVNIDALKAEFATIVSADQEGNLGRVLPGFGRASAQAAGGENVVPR